MQVAASNIAPGVWKTRIAKSEVSNSPESRTANSANSGEQSRIVANSGK